MPELEVPAVSLGEHLLERPNFAMKAAECSLGAALPGAVAPWPQPPRQAALYM